jgi:uncharacterized protein (DUF1501 family)
MTLIVVFLRGGADGWALVPPVGDDAYHRLRPLTGVAVGQGLPLAGPHVLHPDMLALAPWWQAGQLSIVTAAGTTDATRSHFSAQDFVEHGGTDVAGGWLGRWLQSGVSTPLAAIALGRELPESLRGAPGAVALTDLQDLLQPGGEALAARVAALAEGDALLAQASANVLAVRARLQRLALDEARAAAYPDTDFARDLARVAALVRADVGLRVACVDLNGWDSHIAAESFLPERRTTLAGGLAALAADLGPCLATTSIVVVSEFGRRCAENASLGTDHGRAGCALVLGGGTPGGIVGTWPGLAELEEPGDLPVTTDLRDVFTAVLARHGGCTPAQVFPGYRGQALAI